MACTTFMPTNTNLLAESPRISIHGYVADHSNETDAPTLHPDVAYDPIAAKTSHERWALLYKTACIVTLVAFTALFALAIWSSGATAVFESATIAVLLLLLSLPAVTAFALNLWTDGLDESEQAAMAQKLIEKMEPLTENVIAERLKAWGITSQIEPARLASVLAQYDLLVESSARHLKRAEAAFSSESVTRYLTEEDGNMLFNTLKVEPAADIEPHLRSWTIEATNFTNPSAERIQDVRIAAAKNEFNAKILAAWDKFRAAKLLKLMENPYLTRAALSEFYCAVPLSVDSRALLANRLEDPNINVLVKTRSNPPVLYSIEQLLEQSREPIALAREIFQLGKA